VPRDSVMPTCRYATQTEVPFVASFDGGRVTSDGGLPWLAEAEAQVGICRAFAACVPEWRRGPVTHSLETLVRQRVFQIACGYEDQDDADTLRVDPLLKLVCGRLPETGIDLASQPTMSRLENAVHRHACADLAHALVAVYLQQREQGGRPPRILLDLDSTDDPVHGHQEGEAYHAYYGQHMYHPLLIFDGDTDQLITAILRPGNVHASRGVLLVLKRLIPLLWRRWPGIPIEVRADGGFAVPALYDYCEAQDVTYRIGLIPNRRLENITAPLLARAKAQQAQTGEEKVRLVEETVYRAGTWSKERRVVYKAETLAEGSNTRFIVTNGTDPAEDATTSYDTYVDRGDAELWIKDLKRACKADRLSDCRFWPNQFRLFLHAAAYWLLDTLRRWLQAAGAARRQLDTLRLHLLKVGGRVRQLLSQVRLHLASGHPSQHLWSLLAARFASP